MSKRIFATVEEAKAALDGRIATNGIHFYITREEAEAHA